jgi:aspartyl-tRNA(Asn)/glutamyl-tRNA(Gln) amidotransferase subunit B
VINNLFSLMNEHKQTIEQVKITPAGLVELLKLVEQKTINNNTAKEVLAQMFTSGQTAKAIVESKGLAQISDEGAILAVVQQIMQENPAEVAAVLEGKDKLIGWFVGQAMRQLKGKGNPDLVNRLLKEELAKRQR